VEGVGDGRSTLDEELDDAAAAQVVEHRREVTRPLEARVHLGARRRPAEDDAHGVGAGDVADGERRVVGADRAGPDEHGLALGAQPVGIGAGPRRR
jgi:hypothetical protein